MENLSHFEIFSRSILIESLLIAGKYNVKLVIVNSEQNKCYSCC